MLNVAQMLNMQHSCHIVAPCSPMCSAKAQSLYYSIYKANKTGLFTKHSCPNGQCLSRGVLGSPGTIASMQ